MEATAYPIAEASELRDKILEATIAVFNEKGLKFTMDDIASELSISKKTIYTVFKDKQSLFYTMVDYCFGKIKESEAAIMEDESMTTLEKIRRIIIVLPDRYREVDFTKLDSLKDKYPKIYAEVEKRLETGWENTIALLEQGMEEGCIRRISIPVFKTMVEGTIEQFFQKGVLVENKISYQDALDQMMEILMEGILNRTNA